MVQQDIQLSAFLEECCAENAVLAKAKSLALDLELEPELTVVRADPLRLRQTLDNLIGNAVKYSPAGKAVTVSARLADRRVEIAVSDQGTGIPAEEIPLLFKDYGRASIMPTGGERSVGLGLAIAHRIIRAHGGSISVHSRVGSGATFTVTLPLKNELPQKAVGLK